MTPQPERDEKSFDELLESVNPGDTVTGLLKADLKTIHHQELQKALRCGKGMGDGSICGCKLDCHLHDWRQRDELQKAREEEMEEQRVKLLFLAQGVLKELNKDYSIDIKYADKKQWVEPEEFERIFLHRFNNAGLEEV